MMRFLYNSRKAAQAAAYLVSLNGGQMDAYSLIKLLYLADRKSLSEGGRPITGDAMVSMPYGPVLSRTYDEIKAPSEIQSPSWSECFATRENNIVALREDNPSREELSEYERNILRATLDSYKGYGFAQIHAITASLPEYEDPHGSSLPIDPATILREEGWTEEEIEDARMSVREEVFLGTLADRSPQKARA